MASPPNFISCDWGTTSMRLRWMETARARVRSELEVTNCGVREVAGTIPKNATSAERAEAFQKVLAQQILALPEAGSHLSAATPVVISGMASSSIGWKELPYAAVPFAVDGSNARCEWLEVNVSKQALPVLLVSGLATTTEILRGEETQVIGLLAQAALAAYARDALIVLPGTHSKHVRVKDGNVVGLQTFMTGELFDVLRHQSVLRFTTDGDETRFNEKAFSEGVQAAKSSGLLKSLFQVRTRGALSGISNTANRAFLSGLLIGAELCEGLTGPDAVRVLLAASEPVAKLYQLAAAQLNLLSRLEVAGDLRQAVVQGHAMLLERFHVLRRS